MWKEKFHFDRIAKEASFWLLAIVIIMLFTGFQIWLERIADGWMVKIVLSVSVTIELLLFAKISDLFS